MRLLIVCVFFTAATSAVAQFRCANVSFFLPSENASLIVSPLEYNKVGAYVGAQGIAGVQGQLNLNSIYSAIGITSNYLVKGVNSTGIQFATHSYLTRKQWHTGLGGQLEVLHQEGTAVGAVNIWAWSVGWHVMSNPAGRFLFGVNYKNKDLQLLPFTDEMVLQDKCWSVQVAGSMPLSRKYSLSAMLLGKRSTVQNENANWYQATLNVNTRLWSLGTGWKNWGSGNGLLTRAAVYYRNYMAAYVLTSSNVVFTKDHLLHEVSISKKF